MSPEFSKQELIVINNALNEVMNGVRDLHDDAEFEARLGITRMEARKILKKLQDILDNSNDKLP